MVRWFVGGTWRIGISSLRSGLPTCGELGTSPPEFFGRRLQTSIVRATVEDSTAVLCQTLRTGRPLVGGLSFHGVLGLCMSSLAHRLQGGVQAQGLRRRPMQAWVSCSRGRTTACDPQTRGLDSSPSVAYKRKCSYPVPSTQTVLCASRCGYVLA